MLQTIVYSINNGEAKRYYENNWTKEMAYYLQAKKVKGKRPQIKVEKYK